MEFILRSIPRSLAVTGFRRQFRIFANAMYPDSLEARNHRAWGLSSDLIVITVRSLISVIEKELIP